MVVFSKSTTHDTIILYMKGVQMSRVGRSFRITGKIIKWLFIALIAFINGILIWRMLSSSDPSSLKPLTPNEALYNAYEDAGDSLEMFRQEQRSITSAENNYGYFSVTNAVFVPDANQVQVTLRYNNSTIRHLEADYGLEETPSRHDDLFDVTLLIATDLTPQDTSDNDTNAADSVLFTRVSASECISETKNLYNYRRLVFDFGDSDMSELLDSGLLLAVYVDIYYNGSIDYDSTPYGTLCIYDYASENIRVKLNNDDIKAMEKWKEEND